ncbi:hypothetical protein C2W62_18200 [Candidatus Entotheonella serta]|nr:hypothetical protein C2W62_18200 [Candidatus Entotheonella serta]
MRPGQDRSTKFLGTKREVSWQRIKAMVEPEGITWNMWQREDYPNWSLPGLEAAKCAALQSHEAYDDMHFRLFRGFFEQGVNIANIDEVLALARQSPLLDYSRFVDDLDSGVTRRAIFDEYEEAVNDYLVYAIPTVIFPDNERVVGAVPMEEYEKVLEKFGVTP